MRIIAGQFKRRRLKSPDWEGLRPTSDKLRETLFNVLAPRIDGARVLDGYAGTGALGLEALSRGAAQATFVERDPRAVALIRANADACGAGGRYTIARGDFVSLVPELRTPGGFDVILLDPPYEANGTTELLGLAADLLSNGGVLVLEHASRHEPEAPPTLERVRRIASGDSALSMFIRKEPSPPPGPA